jgi:hypothetical protein
MFTTRLLMSGLIAFGLASAPTGVVAAEPHAHAATEKIRLDNGKKWPTDEALRRGMGEIRTAMADALSPFIATNSLPETSETGRTRARANRLRHRELQVARRG